MRLGLSPCSASQAARRTILALTRLRRSKANQRSTAKPARASDAGAKLASGIAWYGLVGSISLVIDGGYKMPAYPQYSDQQIANLFAYIESSRK